MNKIIRKIDEEIENANQRIKQSSNLEERHGYCKYQDGLQKAKEIIQSEQKEPTEEDLKERYYQAREIIKEFCQFEDCQENCQDCPYPLSVIRCGEEWEFKKGEPKTNGDRIREMNNEELS